MAMQYETSGELSKKWKRELAEKQEFYVAHRRTSVNRHMDIEGSDPDLWPLQPWRNRLPGHSHSNHLFRPASRQEPTGNIMSLTKKAVDVLVVEDEPDLREGLAFLLGSWGHAVVTAANGREALERLDRMARPPRMIILDLIMPEMNGWELRRSLLERPAFADVPVLLVSGVADLDETAKSLSAVACLRKPIEVNELSRLVDTIC